MKPNHPGFFFSFLKLHILFYLVSIECWKSFVLISVTPVKTKVSIRQKSVLTVLKAGPEDQNIWVSSAALFSAPRLRPDSAAKTLGTEMSRSQRNYRDMFCWCRDAHAFFRILLLSYSFILDKCNGWLSSYLWWTTCWWENSVYSPCWLLLSFMFLLIVWLQWSRFIVGNQNLPLGGRGHRSFYPMNNDNELCSGNFTLSLTNPMLLSFPAKFTKY